MSSQAVLGKSLPSPPQHGLLGGLRELQRNGLLPAYYGWWQELGDAFRIRIGPRWICMFAHPDHVRHIQVTAARRYIKGAGYARLRQLLGNGIIVSEDGTWRDGRRRMQPLFHRATVDGYVGAMSDCVAQTASTWQQLAEQGEPVDIHQQFLPLTMQIFTRCLLGSDLSQHSQQIGDVMKESLDFIAHRTFSLLSLPLFVPLPSHRRFRAAIGSIQGMIADAIDRQHSETSSDSPLLRALLATDGTKPGLAAKQVQAEVLNIFFAGYETTSLALTWALYLLAEHPVVMEEVANEANNVLGGELPTVGQLEQLQYTRAVFQETIRLYPPAWIVARQTVEDDQIAGFDVPRGTIVLNCPYITHRHPSYWDAPDAFRPERFVSTKQPASHPFAYVPFGAGQRICFGEHFAMTEAILVLAMLCSHFRFERVDDGPVIPVGMGTLYPKDPLRLRLHRR
ncbi:MAG: cytochrome P450 [Pirellulaceae bacterium]|jgi:cytochrome P450|nr:cytochrome P450 [Pirellulaceae bacterium]